MHRSKRALAKVRQSQTATPPLTPDLYAPTPTPPKTEAQLAAEREERIEIAVRSNAQIFSLKTQLQWETEDHKKERKNAEAQYARLNSRIERLEQDISAQWANYNARWIEAAEVHKEKLLDLVKRGLLCRNAAPSHEDIVKEIEKKEETLCQTNN